MLPSHVARLVSVLLLAVPLLAAGCGGDDDGGVPDANGIDASTARDGGGRDGNATADGPTPDVPGSGDAPSVTVYRVPITIEAAGAVPASLRLVLTAATFAYAHAAADGSDLRFSTSATPGGTYDVDYFVETWDPSGDSVIWLRVDGAADGQTIYLFYGFPGGLSSGSDFAAVFPTAYESTDGAVLAGGSSTYDAFIVAAGHTVQLPATAPVTIRAQYVRIDGRIDGAGRGHPGGDSGSSSGDGPGGGGAGGTFTGDQRGGGGGGHGGAGGPGANGGAGGVAYGSATDVSCELGSGGGYSFTDGGNGGGAISIEAAYLTVGGAIDVDGRGPVGAGSCCFCPGAGAGGGVLLQGWETRVSGTITAVGGNGGGGSTSCGGSAPRGGGGGGGGRVKIFGDAVLDATGSILVTGTNGGFPTYGVVSSRGGRGSDGSSTVEMRTFSAPPPVLAVGAEEMVTL
jgi:hypothetical protein